MRTIFKDNKRSAAPNQCTGSVLCGAASAGRGHETPSSGACGVPSGATSALSAEHLAAAPPPQTPPDRRLHACPSSRPASSRHPCHTEPCPLGVPRHDTRLDCPGPSLRLTRCVRTSPHSLSGPRRVPPRPGAPLTRRERGPQWGQVGQEVKAGRTVRGLRPTPPLARQAVSRATCIPTCGKRARGQRVTVSSCSAEGLQTSDSQRATLLSQEVGDRSGAALSPGPGSPHSVQGRGGGPVLRCHAPGDRGHGAGSGAAGAGVSGERRNVLAVGVGCSHPGPQRGSPVEERHAVTQAEAGWQVFLA